MVIALMLETVLEDASTRVVAGAVGLAMFALVWICARWSGSIWSVPGIALLIFALFHGGALPELALGGETSLQINERWIYRREAKSAMWLSLIAMTAFVVGVVLMHGLHRPGKEPTGPPVCGHPTPRGEAGIRIVGSSLVVLAVGQWFIFAQQYGLTPASRYADYLAVASNAPLQLIYIVAGIGLCFVASVPFGRSSMLAVLAFASFAVVGFPIGLRGEVLFPLAAAAPLIAERVRVRSGAIVMGGTILLAVSALVSRARQGEPIGIRDLSPLSGLAELGSSLQVVAHVFQWQDELGVSPVAGASYAAPVLDAFSRYALREPVLPESLNSDYMSTQVAQRVGNIGGSVLGEAQYNFGILGAVVILALWGIALTYLGTRLGASVNGRLFAGVVLFMFMMHVRNSSNSLPTIALLATIAACTAWLTSRILTRADSSSGDSSRRAWYGLKDTAHV